MVTLGREGYFGVAAGLTGGPAEGEGLGGGGADAEPVEAGRCEVTVEAADTVG